MVLSVELTIDILKIAAYLEHLTLDTTYGDDRRLGTFGRCPASVENGQCPPMSKTALAGAHGGMEVAHLYVAGRVPTNVQFEVLEPCSRSHIVDR